MPMDPLDLGLNRSLTLDKRKGWLIARDQSGEYPVIAVPMEAFFGFVNELYSTFSSGASVILERVGEGAGIATARYAASLEDPSEPVRAIFNESSRWGYGRYE